MHSDGSTVTTAVIYAAKSTADKAGSIPDQIARCAEYARQQAWESVVPDGEWHAEGGYWDEAASAYSGSRGPGLAAAKERAGKLAEEGRDVVLLVFNSDRLARGDGSIGRAHLVEHILDGMKARYRVESVSENLGGEMAVVFGALYGARNHADSKAKSDHNRRAVENMAKAGRYVGSRRPYGYRFDGEREKRRLVMDETEAETIRLMADWYESGAGDGEVAGRLNAAGVPSPSGVKWDSSQVRNLLRSPLVAGLVHLRKRDEDGRRFFQTYSGLHDPIIEPERWERLQAIRAFRRPTGRRPNGHHVFVGGVLRCPGCGSALRARTTPAGYAAYECSARWRKDDPVECRQPSIDARKIEALILDGLLDLVFDPEETRVRIEAAAEGQRERAVSLLAAAEKRLRTVDRKRAKAMQEYAGVLSAEHFNEAVAALDQERGQADAHAAELREAAAAIEAEASDLDAERAVIDRIEALQRILDGERDPKEVDSLRQAILGTFVRIDLAHADDGTIIVRPRLNRDAIEVIGEGRSIDVGGGQTVTMLDGRLRPQRLRAHW